MKRFLRSSFLVSKSPEESSGVGDKHEAKRSKQDNNKATVIIIDDSCTENSDDNAFDHQGNETHSKSSTEEGISLEQTEEAKSDANHNNVAQSKAIKYRKNQLTVQTLSQFSAVSPFLGADSQIFVDAGFTIEYLSEYSWIAIHRKFWPSPSPEYFNQVWNAHPKTHAIIKMFGKDVPVPRYQQAYGRSYQFSGVTSQSIEETDYIQDMKATLNRILKGLPGRSSNISATNDDTQRTGKSYDNEFNMCFCNWYEPHHYIGAHADDERQLYPHSPIASITWGSPRTFVLTAVTKGAYRNTKSIKRKEYVLEDGDCLIMGGSCQRTHKHEILKLKSNQIRGNRINFTFRCFR